MSLPSLTILGLSVVLLASCGEAERKYPSRNNGNPNNGAVNNGTANNGVVNNGVVNNGLNNGSACTAVSDFYGQIGGSGDHDGGTPDLNGTLGFDANLDQLTAGFDSSTVSSLVDVNVNGALVTATFFGPGGNNIFWLEDQNARVLVRLNEGISQPTPIRVGARINFHASSVINYEGTPQVDAIDGVEEVSADNPVPYIDAAGQDFSVDQFNQIVRIWGTITENKGPCGGTSSCYGLQHGGKEITFRTASEIVSVGDCWTFVGPLSSFPGPFSVEPAMMQIDQVNFDWGTKL